MTARRTRQIVPIMRVAIAACGVLLALCQEASRASDGHATQDRGVLAGVVTFCGEVPVAQVADNAGQRRELLSVARRTRGLRYVVVHLQPPVGHILDNESHTSVRTPPAVIDQQDETFVPHLLAIHDGQVVRFTNSDAANHNVRAASLEPANQFNVFTGAGGEYEHRFQADPKGRPVLLGCDIHPWMRAWIYVFDHPYFATTDEQGQFTIPNVPPGKYTCVIRQPDIGYSESRTVTIKAGKTSHIDVRIESQDLQIEGQQH